MKMIIRFKTTLALIAALLMPSALVVTVGCSGGCSIFKGAPIAEGADKIVVHAERSQKEALATVDEFLRFEKENRALINNKAVWDVADKIRDDYEKWDNDLLAAIRTYKSVRSQENASKISIGLAAIRQIAITASHYFITESVKLKP